MRLPTHDDVYAAVTAAEPATVTDVARHLDAPWEQRTTVRNRLLDLEAAGRIICDEGRPVRFAINHLEVTR